MAKRAISSEIVINGSSEQFDALLARAKESTQPRFERRSAV
jgi:hypothetical protein